MHKRRALLEALRTSLKTLPGTGGVAIQRVPPARAAFPYITLYSDSEAIDTMTVHGQPRPQDRDVTLQVRVWIRGTPDDGAAESAMDAAALAVEGVMALPAGADDIALRRTDFEVAEEDPELHNVTLTYSLRYTTTEFNPT